MPPRQIDAEPTPFKSLTALRAAHTALLESYNEYEDDRLPDPFVERVESFLRQAGGSGRLFDVDEDRADAQTLLNYWTTVLYGAGRTPRPTVLSKFDSEAAARQVGERCPYRGLQAFRREDHAFFFGRRQLIRDMTESLRDGTFLAVVGLSGSGKSSLVRAGLIPMLQEGALPGSKDWIYKEPIVPGPDPLRSLAELVGSADPGGEQRAQFLADDSHLARLVGDEKTAVVVVDQFEELFTLTGDDRVSERRAFVRNIVGLTMARARHRVVITMRSEFDTYVARYPELQDLFEKAQVRLPPLSAVDLRKAIEKPAERSGLSFEAGLVEELVQQVLGEPAGLPLLQFTLYKLWEQRQGKTITRQIYDDLGGSPREVLRHVADATYESFNIDEDRQLSRRIMLRLVRPGAGLDVTSNRLTRAQLRPVGPRDNVDRVLGVWQKAGLLRVTPGPQPENDQVEVTHEALIRNWPLLVTWVEKERVDLRKRLQLTSSAQQWEGAGRDPGGLLGGVLLAEALTYDDFNDLEKEFVAASHAAADEFEREARRQQERLTAAKRRQLRLATVSLAVALALLGWALSKTFAANRAAAAADRAIAAAVAAEDRARNARRDLANARDAANRAAADAAAAEERARYARRDLANARERLQAEEQLRGKQAAAFAVRSKQAAAEAEDKVFKVQKELSDAQTTLSEAQEKLSDLERRTKTELAKIDEYKAKAAEYEEIARKAEDQQAAAERENEDLKLQLIVLAGARPALLLENGKVIDPPEFWASKLSAHSGQISQTTAGVGRLEPVGVDSVHYLGTVFLAAPDVAIVPSYTVKSAPTGVKGYRIDFREKPDGNNAVKFAASVIGEIKEKEYSLTILRVEPRSPSGLRLPPPLILAKDPPAPVEEPSRLLYVVGYPAYDSRNPPEVLRAIFGNVFEVKRLQPGELLSVNRSKKQFNHDCGTLGGNAGSPVIDLETSKVLGLQVAGMPSYPGRAGVKTAIALWMFADHPTLVKAGVKFQ